MCGPNTGGIGGVSLGSSGGNTWWVAERRLLGGTLKLLGCLYCGPQLARRPGRWPLCDTFGMGHTVGIPLLDWLGLSRSSGGTAAQWALSLF
jgi:hypothetical protein